MNDKFDELAKDLAQSVTRRGALKKFGVGLAGIALASLGLANNAKAAGRWRSGYCEVDPFSFQTNGRCAFKGRKVRIPCPIGGGTCYRWVCDSKFSCPVGLIAQPISDSGYCVVHSAIVCT